MKFLSAKKVYILTTLGWFKKLWILISRISCTISLLSTFCLLIFLIAHMKPEALCLRSIKEVLSDKNLTKFAWSKLITQIEICYLDWIILRFLYFEGRSIFWHWSCGWGWLFMFCFIEKNHGKEVIISLDCVLNSLLLVLIGLIFVNHLTFWPLISIHRFPNFIIKGCAWTKLSLRPMQ